MSIAGDDQWAGPDRLTTVWGSLSLFVQTIRVPGETTTRAGENLKLVIAMRTTLRFVRTTVAEAAEACMGMSMCIGVDIDIGASWPDAVMAVAPTAAPMLTMAAAAGTSAPLICACPSVGIKYDAV